MHQLNMRLNVALLRNPDAERRAKEKAEAPTVPTEEQHKREEERREKSRTESSPATRLSRPLSGSNFRLTEEKRGHGEEGGLQKRAMMRTLFAANAAFRTPNDTLFRRGDEMDVNKAASLWRPAAASGSFSKEMVRWRNAGNRETGDA